MKLRFKLRTLLITTAVVGLFLALQMYVHNKSRRFMNDFDSLNGGLVSEHGFNVDSTSVAPVSISDVFLFRRRCQIGLSKKRVLATGESFQGQRVYKYNVYLVSETSGPEMTPESMILFPFE